MDSTQNKRQNIFLSQTFFCILFLIVNTSLVSANSQPETVSIQDEIITYVNRTVKLSCAVQNRNQRHVTWSRVNITNGTQKLISLLYVDFSKYTPLSRYHLIYAVEKDNSEYWNLEIRQIHLSDEGYYCCVLTSHKPISKIYYVKVIDNTRNLSLAVRSTIDKQLGKTSQIISSLSSIKTPTMATFLMIILILVT